MTSEQKEKFGKALYDARVSKDITQFICAKHCGVSVNAYQYWERGISEPKADKFNLICTFLGIDKDVFL